MNLFCCVREKFIIIFSTIFGIYVYVTDIYKIGYINSKIPVSAKILCAEETSFSEHDMGYNYLYYFRHSKGTIEALRNTADAAVLLGRILLNCSK